MWDESKNLYRDENLLILKTTYKDNNFLSDDDIKALEFRYSPKKYARYKAPKDYKKRSRLRSICKKWLSLRQLHHILVMNMYLKYT